MVFRLGVNNWGYDIIFSIHSIMKEKNSKRFLRLLFLLLFCFFISSYN
ncbi:Uncharacterised protein [Streptococcus pneumoniae]|nr:Uncharacterised protein [Streptococcus pneumoniae]